MRPGCKWRFRHGLIDFQAVSGGRRAAGPLSLDENHGMIDFQRARRRMVEAQIAARGVADRRVLDAMRKVPREKFVDDAYARYAYDDTPLPIAAGQTVSQPLMVAIMIEAAEFGKTSDRVLEVGAGSGYAAAVMSLVSGHVVAVERHAALAAAAQARLAALGYDNVEVEIGDGSMGWPEKAPFDAIIVAASGHSVPAALKEQLAIGGRLVIPVGRQGRAQRLVRLRRVAEAEFVEDDLGGVSFVPLVGAGGWAAEESLPHLWDEEADD